MSPLRVAQPSEKVLAVASAFRALKQELHNQIAVGDPGVQATLLDVACRIAMGTDTRDLGIMGSEPSRPNLIPCDHILRLSEAYASRCTLVQGHDGDHEWSDDVIREFG